ncbi:MAG TPA: ATP-binding protein [Acidimicrobiia bacterium]|nr:ATP-binding protein [Acidimicrobiia bacterium]
MSSRRSGRGRTRLSLRLLLYFAVAYLVLILMMTLVVDRSVRAALLSEVDDNLVIAAQLASEGLPDHNADLQTWAEDVFRASGYRTTLIATDGEVLADSHTNRGVMENHAGRPEVQAALEGRIGTSNRISDTTGFDQRYVALPPQEGLIVRLSVPAHVIADELGSVRMSVVLTAVVAGLLGVAVVGLLARRLAHPITELTNQAREVAKGNTDVTPSRHRVAELDELGQAISSMADRAGERITVAEQTTATLEIVLGALSQGTILFNGEDRVVYANPRAYSILGAVPDRLGGLAPLQLQTAVMEARDRRDQAIRILDHGSPSRRLRCVATPFAGDDRVLLLVDDITEGERTDAIRRDFVANASHELKTPVSTIIASSEALQIGLQRGDASVVGFAARVEDSARQLDRLVGDLLDLSRLEKDNPELSPVRIDYLVRDEVERIRGEASDKGLDVELQSESVTAMVNHRDVAIATRNLLDNAIRYTPEGGSITVTVNRDDGHASITIADTGVGIPTRDIERVFERFYRVDAARSRSTGGTGLGLSIVKHVAESHGGSVSVESELGVGSTFTIRLPADGEGETTGVN